jgi:hypothetical protein
MLTMAAGEVGAVQSHLSCEVMEDASGPLFSAGPNSCNPGSPARWQSCSQTATEVGLGMGQSERHRQGISGCLGHEQHK